MSVLVANLNLKAEDSTMMSVAAQSVTHWHQCLGQIASASASELVIETSCPGSDQGRDLSRWRARPVTGSHGGTFKLKPLSESADESVTVTGLPTRPGTRRYLRIHGVARHSEGRRH